MEQRLSIITLGVHDFDAARRFYVDGLGWAATLEVAGEVVFIQVAHGVLLGLFAAADLAADAGISLGSGAVVSLAHNVSSEAAVEVALADAERAGATIVKPAQRAAFGGYHGYFSDPSGFLWEVAHNPGLTVDPDGRVNIGPV